MSGRKQHYIPQVLLKGFSASPDAKAPPIFVYSRNRGCYKTNTKDTAAEREFYSAINDEEATLDDSITEYENELAKQLELIKANGVGPIEATLPATVIAHLAIRNDHTRKMFTNAGSQLLGAIGEMFGDTGSVRELMGMDKPPSRSRVKQMIKETVTKRFPHLDRNKRALMEVKLAAQFAKNFDQFYEQQKPHIATVNTKLKNSVGDLAKSSHVKALEKSLAPELRIETLSKLNWNTVSGDFLLPDCVAIAMQSDQSVNPYILTNGDDLQAVFMPINSRLGIIGSVEGRAMPNEAVNGMLASCSSDFFTYPVEDAHMKSLVDRIGSRTSEVISHLTAEAVQSSKLGLKKPGQ